MFLTRHHCQAVLNPDLVAAVQTLPLPEVTGVNADDTLPSTSMGMDPQLQEPVSLAQSEFLQLLTLQ